MEEACEYGVTRGTFFVARRLEVVAVAGLLWNVLSVVGFRFFFRSLYFECTRPAASMRPLCLIYLSNSNEARPRERSDRRSFFSYRQKSLFIMRPFFVFRQKVSSYPGTYRVPLFNLSVCVSVSVYV